MRNSSSAGFCGHCDRHRAPGGTLAIDIDIFQHPLNVVAGFRKGDGAEMAMIEFVDFNEVYNNADEQGTAGQGKRRRRRKAGSGAAAQQGAADTEVIAEELTGDDEDK